MILCFLMFVLSTHHMRKLYLNKNAFQWDVYRPLVDYIPACTTPRGEVGCIPACTGQGLSARGCVCPEVCLPRGCLPRGVSTQGVLPGRCLPGGCLLGGVCPGVSALGCLPLILRECLPLVPGSASQHAMGQTPPCGQTDTCENITFGNFICVR